jgi:DNA-binding transcriptional LysR family regulator
VGATAAALVDLSTVAGNKISNPPWVKFQSAGWVNFPSAPTLTLNSNRLMVKAAIQGMGIAYVPDFYAEAAIKDGLLETILGDWCPAEPGLALYYSGHRQVPAVLRAFIDLLKETQPSPVEIQEQ